MINMKQYRKAVATLRPNTERMRAVHAEARRLEREAIPLAVDMIRAYGVDIAYATARLDRETSELAKEVSAILLGVKRGTRDAVTAERK